MAGQWFMPAVTILGIFPHNSKKSKVSVLFTLMRIGRLLRIVRLFRLVRIVRPLYELAQGVLDALQGMFWVLVIMVMAIFSAAILCTQLIGHSAILTDDDLDDPVVEEIRRMFETVPESMSTLFGTISSWSLLKFVPLFDEMPYLRPVFVLFYIYSAWALLAIMTGVVSENMIAIREQMLREDEEKEAQRKQAITQMLHELFEAADADKSGTVSREEFEDMIRNPGLMKKLIKNTNMRVQDLHDLFEWLDHDGGGTITIDEFMQGFKWVNERLRAKSLVKFQQRLTSDLKAMEGNVTRAIGRRFHAALRGTQPGHLAAPADGARHHGADAEPRRALRRAALRPQGAGLGAANAGGAPRRGGAALAEDGAHLPAHRGDRARPGACAGLRQPADGLSALPSLPTGLKFGLVGRSDTGAVVGVQVRSLAIYNALDNVIAGCTSSALFRDAVRHFDFGVLRARGVRRLRTRGS